MLIPKYSELALSKLSAPQRDRDRRFIEVIREECVAPLLAELEEAVPGYLNLSDTDKYLALLRLNEEHAPYGEHLLVDFGFLPVPAENAPEGILRDTTCAFYSGKEEEPTAYLSSEFHDGARLYLPLYIQGNSGLPLSNMLVGNLWHLLNDYSDGGFMATVYPRLPVCFKIALVAELVRQNVVTTPASACRFAAGFGDGSFESTGIDASTLVDSRGQRYGWTVTIRTTKPSNAAMDELASWMRHVVSESVRMNDRLGVPDFDGSRTSLFSADKPEAKPARGPRTGTVDLIWFINVYLPEHGQRVGRGGNISWTDAFLTFDSLFPDRYHGEWPGDIPGAVQNFRNAYYNATRRHSTKAQKGGNDGA